MTVAAPPLSPYKGLMPYEDSELDALLFFGRERETDVIVANLMAARLTVLYGPTGVGKSSTLGAGVGHRLRREPGVAVVVQSTWTGDPVADVLQAAGVDGSFADGLERAAVEARGDLYLILDQFEEYFLYHGDAVGPGTLAWELPELLNRRGARVNVLIAIREDAVAKLDAFKGRIANVFGNFLRLDRLDRRAGRAAIVGPVARWNELVAPEERVEVEPELVEAVLDQVAAGRVGLGRGRGGVEGNATAADGIETPFLQLVLERLWATTREAGENRLRPETLERLGGASAIVRDHLERALEDLDREEKNVAARIFNHLVTPSGTKIAHRVGDLADYAEVSEPELAPVLAALGRERIVRAVDGGENGATRYEIFHDVLADPVLAWRGERRLQLQRHASDRRHRRLAAVAAASLLALVLTAGVAIYALAQRGHARTEARQARARELVARAAGEVTVDPQRSLRDALHAAALGETPQVEDVLRTTLLASRVRRVLIAGTRVVRSATFDASGSLVATADRDGTVKVFRARDGRRLEVLRHPAGVTAAVFAPDGRTLLTACTGGRARVWRIRDHALVRTLRQGAPVTDVAFAPTGGRVATAGADGEVRIWRARDGRLLRRLRAGARTAHVAFDSAGARVLVSVAGSDTARIFDARSGASLLVLRQAAPLTAAAYSPGGRLVVTAGRDHTARIWDATSGALVHTLGVGSATVLTAAFSPRGTLLVTAGTDGVARIWNVNTGALTADLVGHSNYILAAAFSRDGQAIVTGSTDRTARVWNVSTGDVRAVLRGHSESVTSASFSPDGTRVLTAGDDGTARLWDPQAQPALALVGRHAGVTTAVASPTGKLIASAGTDDTARIWNSGGGLVATLRHGGVVAAVTFSRDGQLVATASADGTARIWQRDGSPLRTLRVGGAVANVAFDSDAERLVTASADGAARIWRLGDGALLETLRHGAAVADARFDPAGDRVVTAGADGTAALWSTDGTLLHRLRGHRGPLLSASFNPSGRVVLTAARDRVPRLWSASTGDLLHELRAHRAPITSASFSLRGGGIVTSSLDHDARTWQTRTGRRGHVLRGHLGPVNDARFSHDGRWVATAGPAAVGIWNRRDGTLLFFLRGHDAPVRSVDFGPDHRVVTASADGTIRAYLCAVCGGVTDLVALAKARLAAAQGRR